MKLAKNVLVNTSIIMISIASLLTYRLIDKSVPDIHILAFPEKGGVVQGQNVKGQVVVTAEANEGYEFLGWQQDGQIVSEDTTHSFEPSRGHTITASFEKVMVEVNLVTPENKGGQVTGGGKYAFQEIATVIAQPNYGYVFEGWIRDGELISNDPHYSFAVANDETIKAKFNLDLKSQTLKITDGDYLLALVNKDTYLGGYAPQDLVRISDEMLNYEARATYLRQEPYMYLKKMWKDAKEAGIDLYVVSAYRSYDRQVTIFSNNVSRSGEAEANRSSAKPGESEHQLGTAVDIVGYRGERLTAQFGKTLSGKWLKENAHKYGFVMSYPEGKEEVTGYIYEPWHYRYIGVEAAMECKESGLTLVEYLMTKPQSFEKPSQNVSN